MLKHSPCISIFGCLYFHCQQSSAIEYDPQPFVSDNNLLRLNCEIANGCMYRVIKVWTK